LSNPNRSSPAVTFGDGRNTPGEVLRVALIADCLGEKGGLMGGAERQSYYMIRALTEAGVDVRIYSVIDSNTAYADALRHMGVESRHFGWMPGFPLRLLLLLKWLRQFRPHIVQSMHNFTNAYSALAGRILRVLSVGGLRSDLQSCLRDNGRFGEFLLKAPDGIAVTSRTGAADVINSGSLRPDSVHVLPNVIDSDGFPEPAISSNDKDCICISVSRLMPLKRLDVFLRALVLARQTDTSLRGVVVGSGPEASQLEQLAAELGLLPHGVRFLGAREDIADLLRKSAMFVFCSESEGTPNVVLEAMAAGLPVITTPAGDAADLVRAAAAGMVVRFGDVESIAANMIQLARFPQLRSRLGRDGRDYIARNCDVSLLPQRLFKIYSDAARNSLRIRADVLERVARYSRET